jgi:Asp-tRNA(Asn)/Glu-tRNA(Gln) amidotransferase A subunit family amidase
MTVLSAEAWTTHRELLARHGDELGPDVASRLRAGRELTPASVQSARAQLRAWQAELATEWAATPVLALPTLAEAPPTIEDAHRMAQIRYTAPINGAGVPALSLPVPSRTGMAASLQLVGPPGSEGVLLSTAAVIEAAVS